MPNPQISLLIPVYKVEAYLQRCIDSVLSQDFTDWEMILVDDGSPDKCPEICERNASKDNRIKVIHKINGGLVSARRAGFAVAKGEYIMHLDSDDYLMPNALNILYNIAIEGDYDIVKGCNRRFHDVEQENENVERPQLRNVTIKGAENYLLALIRSEILPYLWGGLYRRSLFSNELFAEVESVSINEDFITNIGIWKNVRQYTTVDDVVYSYYINPQSMMQKTVISHKHIDKIGELMLSLTQSANEDIKRLILQNRIASHIRCFFHPEVEWNEKQYRNAVSFLQEGNNEKEIRTMMDVKFLKFINYKPLYRIYRTVYNFMFLYLRLRGHRRKVI